jgi:hypothetical protein
LLLSLHQGSSVSLLPRLRSLELLLIAKLQSFFILLLVLVARSIPSGGRPAAQMFGDPTSKVDGTELIKKEKCQ